MNAYERAKAKLEKKYGGERRLQIKHLAALRGWQKVRPRNIEDMENFLAILERVMIALQDSGPGRELSDQNLNFTAKDKLSEEDVQAYKYWLINRSLEDTFETLVEWVELKVQIMEEAKEETSGLGKRKVDKPDERRGDRRDERRHVRGYNTTTRAGRCIVASCGEAHPPWTCRAFKALSVPERRELIAKTRRCFRCLAAGHHRKECPKVRCCGINGCNSNQHSSYLHERSHREPEGTSNHPRSGTAPLGGEHTQHTETRPQGAGAMTASSQATTNIITYATSRAEHVSLMVLPAIIANGSRRLKVNVMLDPCSTGSYVTDVASCYS